jgi:hypothetical protein
MNEGRKSQRDEAFEAFIHYTRNEAGLERQESPREHSARLLSEIRQDIEAGIQSREEAVVLLAKLDVVSEVARDIQNPGMAAEAKEFRSDIKSRYPDSAD